MAARADAAWLGLEVEDPLSHLINHQFGLQDRDFVGLFGRLDRVGADQVMDLQLSAHFFLDARADTVAAGLFGGLSEDQEIFVNLRLGRGFPAGTTAEKF